MSGYVPGLVWLGYVLILGWINPQGSHTRPYRHHTGPHVPQMELFSIFHTVVVPQHQSKSAYVSLWLYRSKWLSCSFRHLLNLFSPYIWQLHESMKAHSRDPPCKTPIWASYGTHDAWAHRNLWIIVCINSSLYGFRTYQNRYHTALLRIRKVFDNPTS